MFESPIIADFSKEDYDCFFSAEEIELTRAIFALYGLKSSGVSLEAAACKGFYEPPVGVKILEGKFPENKTKRFKDIKELIHVQTLAYISYCAAKSYFRSRGQLLGSLEEGFSSTLQNLVKFAKEYVRVIAGDQSIRGWSDILICPEQKKPVQDFLNKYEGFTRSEHSRYYQNKLLLILENLWKHKEVVIAPLWLKNRKVKNLFIQEAKHSNRRGNLELEPSTKRKWISAAAKKLGKKIHGGCPPG